MIRLHTLGTVDLRDGAGREVRPVLQQPKRLALLAYLAVSSPRRFHRRDSLLALFWPELDQEHARASLRRALHFLRSQLGADAIVGRGDDELAVPEAALWCDATALDRVLGSAGAGGGRPADLEATLALYRGPLLDGLYVAGAAPELQDWLDRERLRLRGRAAEGARALADAAERDGRAAEAAGWARRALELAPDDEAALRRYLVLLDRSGERSAALRAYDEFARRLAEDLELEPAPETRALMERLRAAASGRAGGIPAAARGPAAAPPTVGGAMAGVATGEGEKAEGATVTQAATPHPTTIAILPFAVRGDARFGYLGEGLVHLVATKLDGAGALRTVDPRAVFHAIAEGEAAGGSADSLARRLGAGLVLDGAVVEAAGRLEVSAVLHRVGAEAATGASLARVHATAADEGELFDMVDELARQLLAAQEVTTGTRLTRIAARTTASLDALKPYLVGEGELRAGRYFDAMEQFQAAVDADPSFALAWYRLAAAAAGCAVPDYAREAADQGAAHQERLGPHDRLVLGAQRAWLHGAVDRAESLYTTITGAYPDDVEAWFHLGDLLFHCNPLRGRSSVEARGSFDRVLGLEPDHVAALVHLVRISALEGRAGEMISLIDRILTLSPAGDQALAMRALRAHATADRSEIAAVAAELQTARAITVGIAFADVALYSGDLAGAAALARGFLQAARAPELRALCHILLAHLALAGDDPATAATELAAAEGLDPTWGLEVRGLFAALPFLAPDERETRRVRDALDRWDPAAVPPSSFVVFAMHNELHPAIRLYLLGLLELRLGNLPAAAGRLEELAELEAGGPLVRNFTVELDAALVRARGRPADALARLERARPELWFQLTVASPFFTLASQRFLRAQLLEELGRPAEAAGWYRSMAERSPYELIWRRAARQAVARLG